MKWLLKSIKDTIRQLPKEELELAISNIKTEISENDEIIKLKTIIENTNKVKKIISAKVKENLVLSGFDLPKNFEKNPTWYIYLKIINFMKKKWITIKVKDSDKEENKYTNIKYQDIYNSSSIDIWSLYSSVSTENYDYLINMINQFKAIYKFDYEKQKLKEKLKKEKQYIKNKKFFIKHEIVVDANKTFKSKNIKNTIKKIAIVIKDSIFPTNFSEIKKVTENYDNIKKEQISAHKKIWIKYLMINNNEDLELLQEEISKRQKNNKLRKYKQSKKSKKTIEENKVEYIKNIKILKLQKDEIDKKIEIVDEEIKIKISEIKIKINKIEEYNQEIERINELKKITKRSNEDLINIDISKIQSKTKKSISDKKKMESELIPQLQKWIEKIINEKKSLEDKKKQLEIDIEQNNTEQIKIKKIQQISNNKKTNINISLIQARLDGNISYGISHLIELLKYDNICIKLEDQNYNIYIDTSKKQYEDWTMYGMMYNHHTPIVIWQISESEFDAISDIYPSFKTIVKKEINTNSKNIFLSDKLKLENTIENID